MSSVLIRQYTNIAGLALLVYDQVITWDKEVNRIWRTSDWALKMMFSLGRYGALAIQIINLFVTHPYFLEKQVIDCHKWFGFQTSAVGILLLNLQLTLMLRVYALYERSTKIGSFLFCWFVFYTVTISFTGSECVRELKLDSACMMMEPPNPKLTICFSVIDAITRGWSTNPILRLVMRDTSWSCLAICCLFIATLPYFIMAKKIGHIVYCLLCSLVSVLTCRTVLNMRGLSNSDGPLSIDVATANLELTNLTHTVE